MVKYDPKKIEKKWQEHWLSEKVYFASDKSKKEKKYVLVEFPYPSGAGLHTGHLRPYVAGDIFARYYRAKGFNVMFPLGWDAFGLPAENYAIKMGIAPEKSTAANIKNAKKQLNSWGMSFDWSREVNTTDPEYYKWTQWIFLQFYKAGLAYEATAPINWCPKDKTGLANEEVIDGKCDRCGTPVEKKLLRQWFLKITAYAQKLIDGLQNLDWPEPIKIQQENWIGRSEGAEIDFNIEGKSEEGFVTVFTTRPDTLFGATYLVLAPEHPLITKLQKDISNWREVTEYIEQAKSETDMQRTNLEKEKTGVEIKSVKAVNPATGEKIPIWIADYVLGSYGTGAIMGVPAHDQRDKEFAEKFQLKIIEVIDKNGVLINSGEFNGYSYEQAKSKITAKFGKAKVVYKLRDWVFSRQRYWGEPIPLIHCSACGTVAVPEKDLPVELPKVKKYEPTGTGESPLAAIDDWVNVKCPQCKGPAKRETNTMPQWAGSSWYFLRYTDPKNSKEFASQAKLKYWMPVDLYFGGMEHTTLHLLYSRFWNLFLHDQGLIPHPEPYKRRQPQGIVLGPDGAKMSKSKGNVANPDAIVQNYGADTLRMFELFLGPYEQVVSWNEKGTVGVYRFLQKMWNWAHKNISGKKFDEAEDSPEVMREINILIKKTEEAIDEIKFNTAISGFMQFLNSVEGKQISKDSFGKLLVVLSPFAPHIAEELWHAAKFKGNVVEQTWPVFDEAKTQTGTAQFVIQVNGKFRANIELAKGTSEDKVADEAKQIPAVRNAINYRPIAKQVFVPDRLINFVVED